MITFVSSINQKKLIPGSGYFECMQTWNKLNSNIHLYSEDRLNFKSSSIKEFYIHDICDHAEYTRLRGEFKKYRPKGMFYWYKAFSIYHSVKNSNTRFVVWLDADVMIEKSPPLEKFMQIGGKVAAMIQSDTSHIPNEFDRRYNVKGANNLKYFVESGLQIFDTQHPDMTNFIEDYYDYWRKGIIFEKFPVRPFDDQVSADIAKRYDVYQLETTRPEENYTNNAIERTDFNPYMYHHSGWRMRSKLIKETLQK